MKRSYLQSLRVQASALALAAAAAGLMLPGATPAAESAGAQAQPAARAEPVVAQVPAAVPATASNTLRSIDWHALSGARLQLTLHMAGPASTPLAFAIDRPARISFDLPHTALALASQRIDVNTAGLDSILAAEAQGRSRLVLDLDRPMPYQTRVEGNDIVVTLGAGGSGGSGLGSAEAAAETAAANEAPAPRAIRSIDFRRSATGAAQLVVRLTDPHTPVDLKQEGSQVVVDFTGTNLPRKLTRRYDTLDFGTPVTGFEAERINGNARIVMNATGAFDQLAYQTDDQYVVEVSPVKQAAATPGATVKKTYNGERLTLNFQNISTRAVLQLLADASGQNIVVSDSVTGNVTLRLQNVPWDQALDIVLTTKGLGKRQDGNVIIVAPAEELAAREKADLASQKDIQQLEPLHSEFLQVNYAKAADIAALLKGKTGAGSSVLSSRGTVAVDDRTNTLLVQDTDERLADVRRLVSTLDIPVKQVEIEARIVIVNNDFERDLGSILGLTGLHASQCAAPGVCGNLLETTGTAAGTDTGLNSAMNNLSKTGTIYPINIPTGGTALDRYNVNLPVGSPAGSIAFGILGANYLVDLELSAAQTENMATVVSSPRVITANQQEASIKQGIEIPYQQSASSGATTIAFKDAVLLLKVKPLITPDNRIILDLTVSDDSVGQVVVESGGVNVPAIDTRAIQTQVLLSDGQTVVLGGILETNQTKSATKIPGLGSIPVLGTLFRTTTHKDDKDELLIFITPKILRDNAVAQ